MSFAVNRRELFRYALSGGALLVVGKIPLTRAALAADAAESITPMVEIAPDGAIRFFCPSPEMGQGVMTSVPMIFAEEMDADFARMTVETMPLWLAKDAEGTVNWRVVPQFSGGSTGIPRAWTDVRRLGAATRALFLEAAAKRWGVAATMLKTEQSVVRNPATGDQLGYGDLVADANRIVLPADFEPSFKPRSEWRLLGRPQRDKGLPDIVTGRTVYGLDATYPGVKTVLIARSPWLDGEVRAVDDTAARAVPGVLDIVVLPRPDLDKDYTYLAAGVAVVAETFWAAKKGRDALVIDWDKGPHTDESTRGFDAQCIRLLDGEQGQIVRDDGDVDAALNAPGARLFRQRYRQPFVSHAQLEVQNAIAHVKADSTIVIGPFQSPSGASRFAAAFTGHDRLKIEVIVTRLGGGFGRRLTSDHAAEAVFVSKACGMPVKIIWTREDDMAHDHYRPAGHHELVATVDADGRLTSWQHRLASASKYGRRDNVTADQKWTSELFPDDFPAGLADNLRLEYFAAASGMPRGSWRAPGHVANAFAVQSFLDEIAAELGEDPLALRLRLLGEPRELPYEGHGGPVFDTGRLASVLKAVARLGNWGRPMPQGQAQGIAAHFTFGGYCAQIAEVTRRTDGSFRVDKVYAAVDVGTVINPEGVRKQAEGSIIDGLSAAMGQAVLVEGGRVETLNFDTYPLLRMEEAPREIVVEIINSEKDPSGMGEIAIPVTAPAVANALARAGGPRVRSLPFRA
ncbi:xanthine dehydrogenase family protein molybdopterin-binding subunit [Gimibacter soli]|uniref:Molybdopterin-dependent oxidoreductase n=1 Tax=Gimibacter soli TaxID=3024400 RepID=A0AAE9XQE5_9PROT|nr:molybdopterin cofactor-binding domain-containing protein [Gimibacter soli]WCL54322.1 molybdopterin-dependent oxidoreductase [Gimibacter soli]